MKDIIEIDEDEEFDLNEAIKLSLNNNNNNKIDNNNDNNKNNDDNNNNNDDNNKNKNKNDNENNKIDNYKEKEIKNEENKKNEEEIKDKREYKTDFSKYIDLKDQKSLTKIQIKYFNNTKEVIKISINSPISILFSYVYSKLSQEDKKKNFDLIFGNEKLEFSDTILLNDKKILNASISVLFE
jgi:hypothetical protein